MRLQRMMAFGIALAVMTSVLLTVSAAPASACTIEASGDRNGDTTTVEANCDGTTAPQPPTSRSRSQEEQWATHCAGIGLLGDWQEGDTVNSYPTQQLTPEQVVAEGLDPTGTYTYWSHQCIPADGIGGFTSDVVYETTPPVPLTVLRDRARARITIPDPTIASNPPLDEPGRFSVVHIPTWLWIEDPWDPIGPETETSGFVTVEVFAVPVSVTWSPGDGTTPFECAGPGVPWAPGLDDSATYCKHIYLRSSAGSGGESYDVSASVLWRFDWYVNGALQPPFEDYNADSPVIAHQVGEIQAVES